MAARSIISPSDIEPSVSGDLPSADPMRRTSSRTPVEHALRPDSNHVLDSPYWLCACWYDFISVFHRSEQFFVGKVWQRQATSVSLAHRIAFRRRPKDGIDGRPEKSMWSFVDSTYSVVAPGNAENSFILVARSPARNGGVHLRGCGYSRVRCWTQEAIRGDFGIRALLWTMRVKLEWLKTYASARPNP
jgi:hypothetical protein